MTSAIDAENFELYAEEAAFLWQLRDAAVRDPTHDLWSLCALDERIEAHLDGLRLAGDAGWAICEAALDEGKGGETFVATVLAVGNLRRIARVLDAGGADPVRMRGIISALGWVPLTEATPILRGLLFPRCSPVLHAIGIAASTAHRADVGAALENALYSSNPDLKARALRAVGDLGRDDLLSVVRSALDDNDDGCRFSAAWSAARFGDEEATRRLLVIAEGTGPHATAAVDMAMRRLDPAMAARWLRDRTIPDARARVMVAGAAALGDPAAVEWLFPLMETPALARIAAAALARITGLSLAAEKLKGRSPEGFQVGPSDDPEDDDVAMDPDGGLPWPNVEALQAWWRRAQGRYPAGTRMIEGKPMSEDALVHVLRAGHQQARGAAAIELALRRQGEAIFEVRAAGERQRRELGVG
ncbi:hypothetical protein A7982_12108 [Minicystis rosea]|nr:hypothetical protein A7982_12108 [Minicystis rosea]